LAGVLGSLLFINPAIHPTLFQYVIFVLASSLILVIVWGLFGPAITRAVHNRKQNGKERTATELLSPDFKALVLDFFDFIDPRRGDYLPNCIEQWKSTAEFDKLPHVDLTYVRDAYENVQDRLRNFVRMDGSGAAGARLPPRKTPMRLAHLSWICSIWIPSGSCGVV
jgi:hypothetical protein